ncbi:ParB N-terminal domain-containing protein [Bradyrhizobium sp. 166]|uniref:ParB N-terminal domain-containing protein n=1 Tax=Bradyrhizobium sp. 166 TaxID=2782638 RepID=UPI001FF71B38|nr:ParB N-terminal domain-containing protein [Bradyrhizobium sp. 166]
MPTPESFPIEKIFVPTKMKKAIKPEIVGEIAESILDIGQQAPISVRLDGDRLVLVEGLHRLEACKALGETTIIGVLVPAELAQHDGCLEERQRNGSAPHPSDERRSRQSEGITGPDRGIDTKNIVGLDHAAKGQRQPLLMAGGRHNRAPPRVSGRLNTPQCRCGRIPWHSRADDRSGLYGAAGRRRLRMLRWCG